SSEGAQEISFSLMKKHQEELNRVLKSDPDIDHVVAFLGGMGGGGQANSGFIFIALKPLPERKASADEIIARLRGKSGNVEGINLFLQAAQDVRVGGRGAKTQFQYTLEDANLEELRTWAPKVAASLRKLNEVKDVTTDQQTAALEVRLRLDRDSAA